MSLLTPTNFLELAQRVAVEAGVSSTTAIATALPSVTTATGSLGRVVNWTGEAWRDLQTERSDWDWMRSSNILGQGISFNTVDGQPSYPLGTGVGTVGVTTADFGKWVCGTFWNYTTAAGTNDETPMGECSFDVWRATYMSNSNRNVRTRPFVVAVGPDQSLCLGPNVSANYTVTGDYYVAPTEMAVDADVPTGLPARFWMLICYKAMISYGFYEAAQEVLTRGEKQADKMYGQLHLVRSPKVSLGSALA